MALRLLKIELSCRSPTGNRRLRWLLTRGSRYSLTYRYLVGGRFASDGRASGNQLESLSEQLLLDASWLKLPCYNRRDIVASKIPASIHVIAPGTRSHLPSQTPVAVRVTAASSLRHNLAEDSLGINLSSNPAVFAISLEERLPRPVAVRIRDGLRCRPPSHPPSAIYQSVALARHRAP